MTSTIRARATLVLLFGGTALIGSSALGASKDAKHTAPKPAVSKPDSKPRSTSRHDAKPAPAQRSAEWPKAERHVPMPRPRPRVVTTVTESARPVLAAAVPVPLPSPFVSAQQEAPLQRLAYAATDPSLDGATEVLGERAVLADAIRLAEGGKLAEAEERRNEIADHVGRTLVEWLILRHDDTRAGFARYATFLRDHPSWPNARMLRMRAEARLWQEARDAGTVLAFFAGEEPLSTLGTLALARAHLDRGDRDRARPLVRSAWHEGAFSASFETQVLETFGALLTRADHRARLRARLYADDIGGALRAAKRLGDAETALVKARAAVNGGAKNAGALLDAVPKALHQDPAYRFTRAQWLRRDGRIAEAGQLMASVRHEPHDDAGADAWWIERRILVRELLDIGEAETAYRVASRAALPSRESLRVDQPFTAGWIALRFLNDPDTAAKHFARIREISRHPTSLARAGYWLGRAAEAAGRRSHARLHYAAAARHSAAYYGQLAQARLGRRQIVVRRPPPLEDTTVAALRQNDLVRAVELLYDTERRDLVLTFVADLHRVADAGVLAVIAETAAKHKDARAMLRVGRTGLVRGLAFDNYAFPTIGVPDYDTIGPKADEGLVYAIARAESGFSANAVSPAKAQGLMQVMPATARIIARRLGIPFDPDRLRDDPVYNVQLGAAEIAHLVQLYDGSHVLAFAGYNAGPGRVKQWVARYGDPRDPAVDVVDWVERIPFTETRNYVQRVMESLQVYRSHFADAPRLMIEADMRGTRR